MLRSFGVEHTKFFFLFLDSVVVVRRFSFHSFHHSWGLSLIILSIELILNFLSLIEAIFISVRAIVNVHIKFGFNGVSF